MSAMERPVYRFGEFELDPHERRLTARGEPVALTPKVFDTLVLLVEQAGHAVGKDELMQTLWPRGFVDDSNLTKHIWLIRRALDDREHDARCIETIPKRGYRFVTPVSCVARTDILLRQSMDSVSASIKRKTDGGQQVTLRLPADPASVSHFVASSAAAAPRFAVTPTSRRRAWIAGMVVVLVAAAVLGAWYNLGRQRSSARSSPSGNAVAIVAFNNLSQNTKDAWLAPALGAMLATEITASDQLHVLPDELVRPARADLAAPLAGGYAAQSLATLRKRLGADYVLSGSYLVSGTGDEPQLRLDLALQDARSGAAIATLARSGAVSELPALVIESGSILRDKLGLPLASSSQLREVAAAQPPTSDVARGIGFALDALHRYDPARARDELLDAVAQAPGYAPTYSYLAEAWSALGYKTKALAAARQAAAHAEGLPEEQRLQINAQVSLAQHDWDKAIDADRALLKLRPQNPEYRYQLISTLIAAGKPDVAQREVTALMKLPRQIDNDPRLQLVQAQVAAALDDSKLQGAHAKQALQQAHERDDTGLAAEASVQLGIARMNLGDLSGAGQILKEARADYARIGNPHGVAWVDQNLGNVYADSDATRAREAYQRALSGYVGIGDRNGEAAIYSDLAIMLWSAGDRDGAETAVRKSLAIRRETADLAGQAWNLAALASIQLDEAASDDAANNYREAIALDEQAGERAHRAYTLMEYSDMQRLRGDLSAAATTCPEAVAGYREIGDGNGIASAQLECAQVALERGALPAARAGAETARSAAVRLSNSIVVYNADLLQTQIAMARGDWSSAVTVLQRAIKTATDAELVTGEAIAQSQLAVCFAKLGRDGERDRAAARAKELRSRVTERQEVFAVDIALAQLRGEMGHRDDAIAALRSLVGEADRRHWRAWSLECRFALVQLLEDAHDRAAGPERDALATDARKSGFNWIVARLAHDVGAGEPASVTHD